MSTQDRTDVVPAGVFAGEEEVPAGTFHSA